MTFRRIDSYATDDPEKLALQLSRLEDNITSAISGALAVPRSTDWVSSTERQRIQLAYETITRVDTEVSSLEALLPSVSADTKWRIAGVKVKGPNSLVLYPVESTAYIDGFSSVVLNAGLHLYVHDGEEWSKY